MADVKFTVDQAVEKLRAEARRAQEALAERAKALEDELRYIAQTLPSPPGIPLGAPADELHVFQVHSPGFPADAQLDLMCWGNRIGCSRIAGPLPSGTYRAVLHLIRLPDGEPF
jgi:hypothetical protein